MFPVCPGHRVVWIQWFTGNLFHDAIRQSLFPGHHGIEVQPCLPLRKIMSGRTRPGRTGGGSTPLPGSIRSVRRVLPPALSPYSPDQKEGPSHLVLPSSPAPEGHHTERRTRVVMPPTGRLSCSRLRLQLQLFQLTISAVEYYKEIKFHIEV